MLQLELLGVLAPREGVPVDLVLNLLGRVGHEDRAVGVASAHLPCFALHQQEMIESWLHGLVMS